VIKVKVGKENGKWVGVETDSGARFQFARKPSRQSIERALKKEFGISRALREEVHVEEVDERSFGGNETRELPSGMWVTGIKGTRWQTGVGCEVENIKGNLWQFVSGNVYGTNHEMVTARGIRIRM
jgi:hypothetical protein